MLSVPMDPELAKAYKKVEEDIDAAGQTVCPVNPSTTAAASMDGRIHSPDGSSFSCYVTTS